MRVESSESESEASRMHHQLEEEVAAIEEKINQLHESRRALVMEQKSGGGSGAIEAMTIGLSWPDWARLGAQAREVFSEDEMKRLLELEHMLFMGTLNQPEHDAELQELVDFRIRFDEARHQRESAH